MKTKNLEDQSLKKSFRETKNKIYRVIKTIFNLNFKMKNQFCE
jgi:hypothetical protein